MQLKSIEKVTVLSSGLLLLLSTFWNRGMGDLVTVVNKTPDCTKENDLDVDAERVQQRTLAKDNIGVGAKQKEQANRPESEKKRSRYIPMPIRRAVFGRANGKCEYRDPLTQRRCNSAKYLQLHHTMAFAKGGEHSVEGLAAFCSHHNKPAAIGDFSADWMAKFQKKPDQGDGSCAGYCTSKLENQALLLASEAVFQEWNNPFDSEYDFC